MKNRYIGRTFIMPGQRTRKKSVKQKLNPIEIEFRDKRVLLVDDSIVRGHTSKNIVKIKEDKTNKIRIEFEHSDFGEIEVKEIPRVKRLSSV